MAKIKIGGAEYHPLFDINVLAAMQERYGDISKMSENLATISELRWIITLVVNEGIEYYNDQHGSNVPLFTEKQVGMKLDMDTIMDGKLAAATIDAFNEQVSGEKKITPEMMESAMNILRKNSEEPSISQG